MQPTREALQAELAELRAANTELHQQLVQQRSRSEASDATAESPSQTITRHRRGTWGWTLLSAALITVAALLAPVAVVAVWAHHELTDTTYFVDTFAPLADEPAVQDFIAVEAVAAIESKIDIDQLADDLFAGLDGLDLDPRAKDALGLLKAPAVAGVKGLIHKTVTDFVRSDAFSQIWRDALTVTHTQFVNTATGQKDAAITIGQNQEINLQLGPVIQAAKEQLIADGFALADRIPTISKTVVIAESSTAGIYLTLYQVVVAVGIWLPWVTLFLFAAGVLVARRRARALAWASGALLLSMVCVGSGIAIGENVFALAVSSSIPHGAAIVLYSGILRFVSNLVVIVGVLAATVLTLTLLAGPWRWAHALRALGASGFAALRRRAEQQGVTTGSTGEWLYRWRMPLRIVVGVLCSAFILFTRPLTPGVITWTAVFGVCVVTTLALASRPPGREVPADTNQEKEIA